MLTHVAVNIDVFARCYCNTGHTVSVIISGRNENMTLNTQHIFDIRMSPPSRARGKAALNKLSTPNIVIYCLMVSEYNLSKHTRSESPFLTTYVHLL